MDQLLNIIKNLSITFIVVSPTIFIFCVTLLGDAIEKAQLEEKAARENDAKGNKEEIEGIEKIIVKAKIDGDTTGLTKKLEHLKKNKKSIEARLEKIKNKYDRISLKNTVTIPVLAFVLVLGSIPIVEYGNQKFSVSGSIALLFLLLIFIFGIAKLYWSLQLVQSISASKRQSETYDRVRETIKLALTEHEQSKKEEVNVTFTEKAFPLNVTVSTEQIINFRVKLIKGNVLHNTNVWFYVPDEFELINPPDSESWRQGADYNPPNIRTVKVLIGTLSTGPYIRGSIKIKTPNTPGKYEVSYKVFAEGYEGGTKQSMVFLVS